MNLIQIREKVSTGRNLIFYNKNVYEYYNSLHHDFLCIYFNEPVPVKPRLIESIEKISGKKNRSLTRLTISELKALFVKELQYEKIIIIFNHFERLTKSSVQVYQYLNSLENVQFICSFTKNFKPEAYNFFKTFELVNKAEYNVINGKDEINITYTAYFIISALCFAIYLKTASSIIVGALLIGGAWFGLIIFRTLMYAGGRT